MWKSKSGIIISSVGLTFELTGFYEAGRSKNPVQ